MFQMEFDFVCEEPEIVATLESTRLQNLRFDSIAGMIADGNQPTWITSRRICGEMAATIRQLQMPLGHCQRHVAAKTQLKSRIRALRELQRTLLENEARSTRDVLDPDGRKVKFVLGEILRLFQQALRDSGVDDLRARNIMVYFGDLRRASEAGLRREVGRIETAPVLYLSHEEALLA